MHPATLSQGQNTPDSNRMMMIMPSLFYKAIYHLVMSCLQDENNSGGAVE